MKGEKVKYIGWTCINQINNNNNNLLLVLVFVKSRIMFGLSFKWLTLNKTIIGNEIMAVINMQLVDSNLKKENCVYLWM